MGVLKRMRSGEYSNSEAVSNVVHYILWDRSSEQDTSRLVSIGGCGVAYYDSPEMCILQMERVQYAYGITSRGGKRLLHEIYELTPQESALLMNDRKRLMELSFQMANYYYGQGHQVLYAVHEGNGGYHIHFAVNAVNFWNGHKWRDNVALFQERGACFERILDQIVNVP